MPPTTRAKILSDAVLNATVYAQRFSADKQEARVLVLEDKANTDRTPRSLRKDGTIRDVFHNPRNAGREENSPTPLQGRAVRHNTRHIGDVPHDIPRVRAPHPSAADRETPDRQMRHLVSSEVVDSATPTIPVSDDRKDHDKVVHHHHGAELHEDVFDADLGRPLSSISRASR